MSESLDMAETDEELAELYKPELMYPIEETADAWMVIICPCTTNKVEPFRSGVSFGMCDGYVGKIIYPKSKYTYDKVMEIVQKDLPKCEKCESANVACQSIINQERKEDILMLIGGNLMGLITPMVIEKTVDEKVKLPIKIADVVAYGGGLTLGILSFFGEKLRWSDKQQRLAATVGTILVTSRGVKKVLG